jgi:hypothetical protein
MRAFTWTAGWIIGGTATAAFVGCGSKEDPNGNGNTEADRLGVAWACQIDDDCPEVEILGAGGDGSAATVQLSCLTQFTDGYCAIQGCETADDCPQGATCVAHTDGTNYCFRECGDKSECNANREGAREANCSANFNYADSADATNLKACIPPSSGS